MDPDDPEQMTTVEWLVIGALICLAALAFTVTDIVKRPFTRKTDE